MALKRHRLAQRRRAFGHSQERLADLLGIERSTVGRWERAETSPLPYIRPKLAAELRITLEELADLLDEVEPADGDGNEHLDQVLSNPASVDLITTAHLWQRVQALTDEYDHVPSALLLAAAGQCHGQVSYLRQNAASNRVRRELFAVEAESATLMGQLVWDACQRRDHATSLRYFNEAITAARQIRDRFTEAHAQLRKSYVALYGHGDSHNGLGLAKSAARTVADTSPSLAGIALMHVGEAHAMLGEHGRCHAALEAAQSHFVRADDADPAGEFFTPTDHARLTGSCHLYLGSPASAVSTLAALPQDGSKSDAIVLGNLSLAHIRLRNLDEAVASLHQAITVVEGTRGGGGLNLVFTAGRELHPWRRERPVQEITDRLLALMSAA
ncbi:DNA-binding transcriptional regulator, XRE-family HTH domain [Thermomonospora echinospora]|uniref:DNA-binding transcriptional regulator, XRE-family HTH domain n=1 Tax=Thermomonospora echinospora TaxID=1992 RepID=A0A1H6AW60_9ACTN|nr:helix-turn-helix transcriptional regulator [Thermomonospora echinospora]SEG52450.1 DNA-binding transcriptional regulator, XRE-family HTH domain [Thermomonospora echinospora]